MKTLKVVKSMGLTMLAVALLALSAAPAGLVSAAGEWFGFDPADYSISGIDGTVVTPVQVGEMVNLQGVEFKLTFDKACVTADSVVVSSAFDKAVVVTKAIDNDNGVVRLVAVMTGTTNFSGNGVLTDITWRAVANGCTSALGFEKANLSDPHGVAIAATVKAGQITVGNAVPVGEVPMGKVTLEGRTDYSGVKVYLIEDACPSVAALSAEPWPGALEETTDAEGKFEFTDLKAGRTYQCLRAYHAGYLSAQKSGAWTAGQTKVDTGAVELLAGNVNQDNCINIFDLTQIASDFEKTGTGLRSDINDDGVVNILDLTVTAKNWNVCGPMAWQ
jgi:hypothetical protein